MSCLITLNRNLEVLHPLTGFLHLENVTRIFSLKVRRRTGHEDPEGEKRYSSTLSLTSALDGVGG